MLNDDEYIKMYSNKKFQNKARKVYSLSDNLMYNDRILLLLYTYEWFKISKEKKFEQAFYHPYLTKNDMEMIKHIRLKYFLLLSTIDLFIYFSVVGYYSYKIKNKPKIILFQIINVFPTLAFGIYLWNSLISKKMNKEVENISKLNKYTKLDVDLEKIIKELVNYNIKLI